MEVLSVGTPHHGHKTMDKAASTVGAWLPTFTKGSRGIQYSEPTETQDIFFLEQEEVLLKKKAPEIRL